MTIALETRDLGKSFGSLVATRNVSLAFEAGLRHAIIGPNGAGKTTFFNLLAGNLRPDAGRVLLGQRDVTALGLAQRARLGIARSFQRNNVFMDSTVLENLVLARAVRDKKSAVFWRSMSSFGDLRRGAEAVAERVGLTGDLETPARALSYGGQRQLEVGLALACDPSVLLLDEPTAGMSPEETARMRDLIRELPQSLTMVIIEHDMDLVMDIADRIIVLDYGSVLTEGTPAQIRASDLVRERYLGGASANLDAAS
jgi:ABC-type branched-subunit amino acid transport system ATPase component